MLTQGDDVEVHALAARGWSISAIARHIGRDRRTVRAYLRGDRTPGVRHRSAPDPIGPFIDGRWVLPAALIGDVAAPLAGENPASLHGHVIIHA